MKMQIKQGAVVYTASGDKVGSIDRVAINPRTKAITHLVVRRGLILPKDKILPVDWVAETGEERITLRQDVPDLERLPDYEEQYFVPTDAVPYDATVNAGYVPLFFWYPPMASTATAPTIDDVSYHETPAHTGSPQTVLGDSIAVKEGAAVITADGQEVGRVEKIIFDPVSNQVEHFVIERGLLSRERKRIPALWVETVTGDRVRLAVEARVLERVPDYLEKE
jgi:uncharacterized protein YrrD